MQVNFNEDKPLPKLYHGSMFSQNELMPGYKRSGELVQWDKTESNAWLYATTEESMAILLGIVSAWEKTFDMTFSKIEEDKKIIYAEFGTEIKKITDLMDVPVYLYEIAKRDEDKWVKVNNPYNNIDTEWKTQSTIKDAIVSKKQVNVANILSKFRLIVSVKEQA